MVGIDIIAGYLGAGKTTWINKMLSELHQNENVVIIENEFGEIGIDGELLSGFNKYVKEINSGCICCTLYGDFVTAIRELIQELKPSRILIEPTGLVRPDNILNACYEVVREGSARVNSVLTIIDATMVPVFLEVGGELYRDQIKAAHTLLVSHVDELEKNELENVMVQLTNLNPKAQIIAETWDKLSALEVLTIAETQTQKYLTNVLEQAYSENDHHHEQDQGYSVLACNPARRLAHNEVQSVFNAMSSGRYGEVIRAKSILTLTDGKRIRVDYVYGKWNQVLYTGTGADKFVIIGKELSFPSCLLFKEQQSL